MTSGRARDRRVRHTERVDDIGRLADENLALSWARVADHCGGAAVRIDGLQLVATGLPVAFFNGAYLMTPTTDPDAAIDTARTFMSEHGVPWLLWVRDDVDDALLAAGRRAGLTEGGGPPVMAMFPLVAPPALPLGLEVRAIVDEAGIDDQVDLASRGFGMPAEVARVMVGPSTLTDPDLAVFVGYVGDVPVSTSMLSVTGSTVGVYTVATPAEHRGRGYGAALSWAAVEEGRRRGCDHAVLQASVDGAPVYRSMGFVDAGRYRQLEWTLSDG